MFNYCSSPDLAVRNGRGGEIPSLSGCEMSPLDILFKTLVHRHLPGTLNKRENSHSFRVTRTTKGNKLLVFSLHLHCSHIRGGAQLRCLNRTETSHYFIFNFCRFKPKLYIAIALRKESQTYSVTVVTYPF